MKNTAAITAQSLITSTALLALTSHAVWAQEATDARRGWIIEPSVSLRQTFTDNQRLQTVKESDSITEGSVGVRIGSTGGSVRGYVDYSLTGSAYARNDSANELRHFLSAAVTAEVIEGQGFIDMRGSYTQQAVSAFGSQSATPGLSERNRADVGSLAVSPYLRGRLGGPLRYEARLSLETTRAKGSDAADVDNGAATLHLDSGGSGAALGWTADASHNVSDFRAGRRTFDTRLRAGVTYALNREFKLGLTAGIERTDTLSLDGESNHTWGLQGDWTPDERTSLSANVEKRFFGNSHAVRFAHRTPTTAWALSDSRDISTSSSQGNASFGSAYDLFFRQFASTEPDATKRDVLVRNYLLTNGINPNTVVIGGFLASAATLQRAQQASVALVGVRNTVTLQASSSRSERADKVSSAIDDLSSAREVRQHGVSLDWALRLTPLSSINVAGSYQRSGGDVSSQQTTLKAITTTWNAPLGARSTMSAGARHAVFDSTTAPYTEYALFGAIRLSF